MSAYELLTLGVEAYLRELDDDEFAALTRRVRPPKHADTQRNVRGRTKTKYQREEIECP